MSYFYIYVSTSVIRVLVEKKSSIFSRIDRENLAK